MVKRKADVAFASGASSRPAKRQTTVRTRNKVKKRARASKTNVARVVRSVLNESVETKVLGTALGNYVELRPGYCGTGSNRIGVDQCYQLRCTTGQGDVAHGFNLGAAALGAATGVDFSGNVPGSWANYFSSHNQHLVTASGVTRDPRALQLHRILKANNEVNAETANADNAFALRQGDSVYLKQDFCTIRIDMNPTPDPVALLPWTHTVAKTALNLILDSDAAQAAALTASNTAISHHAMEFRFIAVRHSDYQQNGQDESVAPTNTASARYRKANFSDRLFIGPDGFDVGLETPQLSHFHMMNLMVNRKYWKVVKDEKFILAPPRQSLDHTVTIPTTSSVKYAPTKTIRMRIPHFKKVYFKKTHDAPNPDPPVIMGYDPDCLFLLLGNYVGNDNDAILGYPRIKDPFDFSIMATRSFTDT